MRWGDLLIFKKMRPEFVYGEGLGSTRGGEMGVRPCDGAVAVQFRPVAVPCRGSEEGLCGVVVALAVAAEKEKGVTLVTLAFGVEARDVLG